MIYFGKILLGVIAGLVIGTIVAVIMVFLGMIGFKFADWLYKRLKL